MHWVMLGEGQRNPPRREGTHPRYALLETLRHALRAVTPHDAAAWLAHCGYAVKP